jgi:bla regulator protein BlaR1
MFADAAILDAIGPAVWRASWQASMLSVAVLAAVLLLRGRLSPAWRYGLWSLVLVRLLLPIAPQARWSVYSLVGAWEGPIASDGAAPVATAPGDFAPRLEAIGEPAGPGLATAVGPVPSGARGRPTPDATSPPARRSVIAFRRIVPAIWLAGVVAMAVGLGYRAR